MSPSWQATTGCLAVPVCAAVAVAVWPDAVSRWRWPRRSTRSWGAGAAASRRAVRGAPAQVLTVDDVTTTMVLLGLALGTGSGLAESLETVARVSAPAPARQMQIVAAALRWGVAWPVAWASVSPVWSRTGVALSLAARSGVSPSGLLRSGAADLREAHAQHLDVLAARIGVRLVAPVGLAFLPAFVLTTVVPVVSGLASQVGVR